MGKIRLYKFYPLASALRNLKQKRLKVSLLDELNDPFEFLNFQMPEREVRVAWNKTRAEVFKDKGLICFSKGWRNPLMWAHYADSHGGLALGFDIPTKFAIQVRYKKERERFLYYQMTPEERLKKLHDAVSTKFAHWEYENEYRMIVPLVQSEQIGERKIYFEDFRPDMELREVIIGARSKASTASVREAAGNKHLKVITTRIAFNSFEIVQQRNKDLQK